MNPEAKKAKAEAKAQELIQKLGNKSLAILCAKEASDIALPESIWKKLGTISPDFQEDTHVEHSTEFWYYVLNALED